MNGEKVPGQRKGSRDIGGLDGLGRPGIPRTAALFPVPGDVDEYTACVLAPERFDDANQFTTDDPGYDIAYKITPKADPLVRGQILETGTSDLRNGVSDIVAIVGSPSQPLTVKISGLTIDGYDPQGREVAVEAGLLFLDAKGSVVRSRVTNVAFEDFHIPASAVHSRAGCARGGTLSIASWGPRPACRPGWCR